MYVRHELQHLSLTHIPRKKKKKKKQGSNPKPMETPKYSQTNTITTHAKAKPKTQGKPEAQLFLYSRQQEVIFPHPSKHEKSQIKKPINRKKKRYKKTSPHHSWRLVVIAREPLVLHPGHILLVVVVQVAHAVQASAESVLAVVPASLQWLHAPANNRYHKKKCTSIYIYINPWGFCGS